MKAQGKEPRTHIASDEEFWERLKEKLREEVEEFLESEHEEELADILEVIDTLSEFKNRKKEIEKLKAEKKERNGGFSKRIILED